MPSGAPMPWRAILARLVWWPPAMHCWMPSCPAAAGRWVLCARYCKATAPRVSGVCCCRPCVRRNGHRPGAASWVVLVGPPHVPFGPALAALGLDVGRLLWVKTQAAAERLWATEQALRCAGVAAVLAWLPQVQAAALRRLQVAAQTHAKLLFVLRPASAQHESSPALLRLILGQGGSSVGGKGAGVVADALQVQVLKRRGPPLAGALALPAPVAVLSELLGLCAGTDPAPQDQPKVTDLERPHALDSLAA